MTTSIIQSHKLDPSEVSLARTRKREAARSRVLEILASLARIGELARRLHRTVLGHYQSGIRVQHAVYFRRSFLSVWAFWQ